MKRWSAMARFVLPGLALIALGTGCELNSSDQGIEIKPGSVTLSPGQSATFKVSGGNTYAWSLNPADGSAELNTHQGDTVVFTLLSSTTSSSNGTIAVTCTSTIPGVSDTSTNVVGSEAYSQTDTAYVYIRPPG